MPRTRRDDNETVILKPQDIEEDYLDVDKPLPGQNYYCISFVSPEKIIHQKELFMYYHYERAFYQKIKNMMDSTLTNLIEKSDDGKIDVSDIIKLKKSIIEAAKEEDVSFDNFKEKLEDFRFRDEEKIGEVFDKQNNFHTSVRGVKVRGVFDSKREADIRASVLQRLDPLFDVFVGQVGYWCPWDPNPHKIDDIEYTDSNLNKLVKEYKLNESKKDQFYQEQKTQRQKDSLSAEERLKHQEGLNNMREFRENMSEELAKQQAFEQAVISNNADISTVSASDLTQTTNELIPGLINMAPIGGDLESLLTINELPDIHDTNAPQAIIQSLELGNTNSKEITLEQETSVMQSDDPWLQRKLAEKQLNADST
jgi:hypothetical protein